MTRPEPRGGLPRADRGGATPHDRATRSSAAARAAPSRARAAPALARARLAPVPARAQDVLAQPERGVLQLPAAAAVPRAVRRDPLAATRRSSQMLVPGIAGMAVMSTTFTALAFNITALREQGILKRMRGTPLPTSAYLAGHRRQRGHQHGRCRSLIITVAGNVLFGLDWPQDWLSLWCSSSSASSASPRSASRSRTRSRTSTPRPPTSTRSFLPMIFISGVFYDENVAPAVIGDVAQALPLKHLIDGLSGGDGHRRGRRPPPRRAARARRVGGGRPDAGDPRLLLGVALDLAAP